MKKKSWNFTFSKRFDFFFLALNGMVSLALLLSYLSYLIPPDILLFPVFFGLTFPVWFILNLLFFIYWIFRKNRLVIVLAIILLPGIFHINHTFGIKTYQPDVRGNLKVLSFNVRLFDVYGWRSNQKRTTPLKIYQFVRNESPDILCLQEFYSEDSGMMNTFDSVRQIEGLNHYHVDYFQTLRKHHHWGMATFSRYPVLKRNRFQFKNSTGNYCIYTDLRMRNDTIRIFNVHMESWHFEEKEKELLKNGWRPPDSKRFLSYKNVYWKLKSAYEKRTEQARELSELIKASPYPVVLCGDVNDIPVSYSYRLLTKDLNDTFVQSGWGFSATYPDLLPWFRIDYILTDKHFNALSFKTYSVYLSDHKPVSVILHFKATESTE